jgi:hypothetical protein
MVMLQLPNAWHMPVSDYYLQEAFSSTCIRFVIIMRVSTYDKLVEYIEANK